MSGIGFWEFIFLCMIGLVVLGPKRLPAVANQLGSWVGQARRMTRTLRRQLEDELNLDKELNVQPRITPFDHPAPNDDDGYSPLHDDDETEDDLYINPSHKTQADDPTAVEESAVDHSVDDEPVGGKDDEAPRER